MTHRVIELGRRASFTLRARSPAQHLSLGIVPVSHEDPEINPRLNWLNLQTGRLQSEPYNPNLPPSSPDMRQISGNNCFAIFRLKKLLTAALFSETFRILNYRILWGKGFWQGGSAPGGLIKFAFFARHNLLFYLYYAFHFINPK